MSHEDDLFRQSFDGGPDNEPHRDRGPGGGVWLAFGVGALAAAAGFAWYQHSTRNQVGRRIPDDAPGRTARQHRFGRYAVTGRTVTIGKPKGLARLLEPPPLHAERACDRDGR